MAGVLAGFGSTVFTNDNGIQFIAGLVATSVVSMMIVGIFFLSTEDRLNEISSALSLGSLGYEPRMLALDQPDDPLVKFLKALALYYREREKIPGFLRELIDESLRQTSRVLETRSSGIMEVGWEDVRSKAIDVLSHAGVGDEIYTTSWVVTQAWWGGAQGHSYLLAKRDAAARGARVVQVFLTPTREALEHDHEFIQQLAKPVNGVSPKDIEIHAIRDDLPPENCTSCKLTVLRIVQGGQRAEKQVHRGTDRRSAQRA
jgi:hypothetical protein